MCIQGFILICFLAHCVACGIFCVCVCVCVCVIKFYLSIKEIEKASDIGIRKGQKSTPFASISN